MDSLLDLVELLEIDKSDYVVALGKTLGDFQFVLGDTANEIVGHANIQRAADAAGQNVDVEAARPHLPSLEYWVARSSRAMTAACVAASCLLPRLQLARQRKQLGCGRLDQPRRFDRRVLAEVQLLDTAGALFDLVGGNQHLPDILVGVGKMLLQFQHAIAQAAG